MSENKALEESSKYIDEMRSWLNQQPHLPKNIEDKMLLRFVHSCYYDVDKAKAAVESFLNIRLSCADLLNNRDPMSAEIQKTMSIVNLAQIEAANKQYIWMWQLNDPGLEIYDYVKDARYFFLASDAYFLHNSEFPDADIVILDVKDLSLKFLTKFNISVAKKLSKYQEDAMPIRLKQVHLINAPSTIDKIFGLLKPFMKKEITELIHFHPPNSQTLFNFIDKADLPADYGGTRPSMAEQNKDIVAVIMSKRKELMDDTLWRAIPTEKKNKSSNNNIAPVPSFRSLAID
ncbi:alpha-tocopherol transfer protein-like [Colias croceus]|uniref:alpha-tocopherol transfer protein-like n=1 Tax=Colias crocea TaxID=72248 RepID=UPI001E27C43D|nr:alpha-tocopherol transfer protein-like [Colias croceus]XP_045501033.1 alpha-tocopherol transfer protein-like [Colias croceus]